MSGRCGGSEGARPSVPMVWIFAPCSGTGLHGELLQAAGSFGGEGGEDVVLGTRVHLELNRLRATIVNRCMPYI